MDNPQKSYLFLASALFQKEFISLVDFDDNRIADGMELRREFELEFSYVLADKDNFPPSVLEVLLALSRRMEVQSDTIMECWFWELLTNLGLHHYADNSYYDNGGPWEIQYILNRWVGRTYKRDGKWGIFPLKHAKKDQRKVEIWYQMQAYLAENVYFL